MKRILLFIIILIFVAMMGIPWWVLRDYSQPPAEINGRGPEITVLNKMTGKIIKLPLEEYVVGVVAAEMPAQFQLEALKAQTLAARTYAVKRMYSYGGKPNDAHPNAEICTDPMHCQAWISREECKQRWGLMKYYLYIGKIEQSVRATIGEIITYNDTVIDPAYHGSCGGRGTENSEDVWSGITPYLRSVSCDEEYRVSEQVYKMEIEKKQLLALVNKDGVEVKSAGDTQDIRVLKKSGQGRVKEIAVFGRIVSGSFLRQTLGLSSTLFTWRVKGSRIEFASVGKGHGVGLCQYGSNGMALQGKDYKTILRHYYSGVKIQKLKY